MLNRWLYRQIDNSALIVFRILFGFLIIAQSWGSILTGYVKDHILSTKFTFNFIGFDFIQPLPGNWMYLFYFIMGVLGIGVLLGYKYRLSMAGFTIMWTYTYLMSKVGYNNHYYLLILLCIFMLISPAHRYYSFDVKKNPKLQKISMPQWVSIIFIVQMGIVYSYAAIAKLYPDWIQGTVATQLMASKAYYPFIGEFLQTPVVIWIVTYFGILFDLLITPLMLWKVTRKYAFLLAIFFHLFNSIIFQIGIFPYLALGLFIFYFPPKVIHRYLLKRKPFYIQSTESPSTPSKIFTVFLGVWFLVQLVLPIRHYFIPGNVLWTEEGHRMSWRMMLRSRSGVSRFIVVDKKTGKRFPIHKEDWLNPEQQRATAVYPDMIWQFAQHIKKEYAKKGKEIQVYVQGKVSVNGHPYQSLINPEVDLAPVSWHYFGHNPWILPWKSH